MNQCPNCKAPVDASAKFCKYCAADLSQAQQSIPVSSTGAAPAQACSNCGAALSLGARFCANCSAPAANSSVGNVLYPSAHESNRMPIIIGGTVLVLLILGGITAALLLTNFGVSSSDGRKHLEDQIQAQSNGLINLVSFEKTNGIESDVRGRKAYEMEYTAEIEFLDDCIWMPGHWSLVRRGRIPTGGPGGMVSPEYDGMQEVRKGQRRKINGKLMFEKTEQGWRPVK